MQVGRVFYKELPTTLGEAEGVNVVSRTKRGFTLIELLVVVVVLAILSAVAFPVFVKTKETAKVSECLSNMRQIGMAFRMYLDDFDDRFPAAVPYGSPNYWESKNRQTLQELLDPYVGYSAIYDSSNGKRVYTSAGVFRCPSDIGVTNTDKYGCGIESGMPVWKSTGSSYEYFASVQEDWDHSNVAVPWTSISPLLASDTGKQRVGAPYKSIIFPTKKAVVGDLCFWHLGDQTPDNRLAYTNTLFADGHASRVRGSDHLDARLQQLNRWHSSTEISSEK
ncbi:MAG: type II secretion system protein [Armatimonadota bacterium]|nr:type II secretion system GspH family protein [bacterium]